VNYRLNILKEASYETQYSFSANLLKFILFSIILFFIVGVGFWCLFAYTGLRNHIPGYPHEEIRANDIENRQKADSLSEFMSANDLYYKNLKAILAGEKVEEVQFNPSTGAAKSGTLNYEISPVDSAAREQVSQEYRYFCSCRRAC